MSDPFGWDDREEADELHAETEDTAWDEAWVCDDDTKASWALRKLGEAQTELDRIADHERSEKRRISDWANDARRTPGRTVDYMREQLIRYRLKLEADNPDLAKTYKLADGVITKRAAPARFVVDDPDEFCGWALQYNPTLVNVTPAVAGLKAYNAQIENPGSVPVVTEDGERIPGVRLVRSDPHYDAKAS